MNQILLFLYMAAALAFAVAGIILLRKRSALLDTKTGYRMKKQGKDEKEREAVNRFRGKLCLVFTVVFLMLARVLIWAEAGTAAGAAVLAVSAAAGAGITVLLPGRKPGGKKKSR